jgi:hypothetical protein
MDTSEVIFCLHETALELEIIGATNLASVVREMIDKLRSEQAAEKAVA